jgi:hypothetical protein
MRIILADRAALMDDTDVGASAFTGASAGPRRITG